MKAIHLTAYPDGPPTPAHFALADEPDPVPGEGEVLVQVLALGMDPAVRMRMSENSRMGPPLALDAAVAGRGVGRVLASRHRDFAPGDLVGGELGWRTCAALPADALERLARGAHPPHAHLNALGPIGLPHGSPSSRSPRARAKPSSSPPPPERWAASPRNSRATSAHA